jgi:hypothetical protein
MKLLEVNNLKKRVEVSDSYEVGLVYKGRRVDILLDKLHYSLEQLLEAANHLLPYLSQLDLKARKYLAKEELLRFNAYNQTKNKPLVSEECLEKHISLHAVQFFDESIDFFYRLSCDRKYELIVEVCVAQGYEYPKFEQWFAKHRIKNVWLHKISTLFGRIFGFS